MKKHREAIEIVVIAALYFAIGFAAGNIFSSPSSKEVVAIRLISSPVRLDGRLMSVAEFQTWLKKRGHYTGSIDGKVSKDYRNSLTQIAWDEAYNDQCGVEDMRAATNLYE